MVMYVECCAVSKICLLTFCLIGRSGGFLVQRTLGIGVLVVCICDQFLNKSYIRDISSVWM